MNALYILVSTICFHTINAPIYQQVAGRSSDIVGENVCVEAIMARSTSRIIPRAWETVYVISGNNPANLQSNDISNIPLSSHLVTTPIILDDRKRLPR